MSGNAIFFLFKFYAKCIFLPRNILIPVVSGRGQLKTRLINFMIDAIGNKRRMKRKP